MNQSWEALQDTKMITNIITNDFALPHILDMQSQT